MFYGQSWALMHFLFNRSDRTSSFSDDMRRYMVLTADGTDELVAFEMAFGIPQKRIWTTVKRYLRKCCNVFRLNVAKLQPEFEPQVRNLSRSEISLDLAQIALQSRHFDAAKRCYELAAQDEKTRPWAEAGLGDLLKFDGEYEAARPHFEKALAPGDPYI
jgi:tetratricopeptide (TPR) repeat protein